MVKKKLLHVNYHILLAFYRCFLFYFEVPKMQEMPPTASLFSKISRTPLEARAFGAQIVIRLLFLFSPATSNFMENPALPPNLSDIP